MVIVFSVVISVLVLVLVAIAILSAERELGTAVWAGRNGVVVGMSEGVDVLR
jgi:hypothetical protein